MSIVPFDNNAQSEAVFRIMVDSIVGLVILVIIMGMLSYFNDQTVAQSLKDFQSIVVSASNTPDGSVVSSSTLSFQKGTAFGASDLELWTGYPAQCFEFQSIYSSIEVTSDQKNISFTQNLQTHIFAKCTSPSCDITDKTDCCIECQISFGKKLE